MSVATGEKYQRWAVLKLPSKLLEICPGTKIVLVTESVPPEKVKRQAAQGYHFPMLPAPFTRDELHAVVFGSFK
jgi:hypothetical protein